MYFGQHPSNMSFGTEWQTSLVRLLDRPQAAANAGKVLNKKHNTLSVEAALAAAADKYQMPQGLMKGCKREYMGKIWNRWDNLHFLHIIPDFIASIRIIYQTAPAAGLRARAITTAQYKLRELQPRQDFKELLLTTPEFACDVAVKGLRQALRCYCWGHVDFGLHDQPIDTHDCHEVWDWIDHGKEPDWSTFVCRYCGTRGTLPEKKEEEDDSS